MLDAYFSALVLYDLKWEAIDNVVAVHDGWFVPAFIRVVETADGLARPGVDALANVIMSAGKPWLDDSQVAGRPGLRVVYDQLVAMLAGSPYEDFALKIRSQWRDRVAAGRWPRFTTG